MKSVATLPLIIAAFISSLAFAQTDAMKGMDMKGMDMKGMKMTDSDMQKCSGMKDMKGMDMKGMDMKGMDAQKCKDMMNAEAHPKDANTMKHEAKAIVKKIDAANGRVTLAHGPVQSLSWPAMTMGFLVKDRTLLGKLVVGKEVNVEFKKDGADYVIVAVK